MFSVQAAFTIMLSLPLVVTGTGTISCINDIVDFDLIDPAVSPPLFTELTPVVDLSHFSTCKLNIAANLVSEPSNCDEKKVQCVQFFFDGMPVRKEKFVPYTLYGDILGGNITARQPKRGKHIIKACAYTNKACTKNEMGCKEMEVDFIHCSSIRAPVVVAPPSPTAPVVAPTQLLIACDFISQPNIPACRSQNTFVGSNSGTIINSPTTIPTEIGLLTQLTHLDLFQSQLIGTIPLTLGQLTQLTLLWLDENQLTGTIPSTIGQLTQLTDLSIANNKLSGTIPSTLGQLIQLNFLFLKDNQLTGKIPSTLGQLTKLTPLALFNNQLTGTIPSTLGQLTQLFELTLFGNQLIGTIPSTLCSESAGIDIYIDCGQITCSCCVDSFGNMCPP